MINTINNSTVQIDNNLFKVSFKHKITVDDEIALQDFLHSVGFHYPIKDCSFAVRKGLLSINTNSFSKNELGSIVLNNGNYGDLTQFIYYISLLESIGALKYSLYLSNGLFCCYENMTGSADFSFSKNDFSPFKLSNFSFVRLINEEYILESSVGTSKITLSSPESIQFIFLLSKFNTLEKIATTLSLDKTLIHSFYTMLSTGDFLEFENNVNENAVLKMWSFHDLLFHNRSRYGRHNNNSGATYRFLETTPPKEIKKQIKNALNTIPLEKPLNEDKHLSKKLNDCLNNRNSCREFDGFDLQTLGHFLYRTLKIEQRSNYTLENHNNKQVNFETYKAPYPSGGAIYELNFYITVSDCDGLEPGFYYYNPFQHELSLLQYKNKQTEQMLWYANACTGIQKPPPILITFAADFERMFWKYEAMAYAAILKHVGVVYQTLYLVATDMNIGACALGNGNTEIFKKLTDYSLFEESSVGEFIIGNKLKNKTL